MRTGNQKRRVARKLESYLSNPSLHLPSSLESEEAVLAIEEAFSNEDGITFSLYFGAILYQKLYAVSIYPERSRRVPGKSLSTGIIRTFIRENRELLHDPRHCIGVWYDAENDMTYLDISVTLSNRAEAIRLGMQYNQIAVFDLEQ